MTSITDVLSILSYPATIFLFLSQVPVMRDFLLNKELVQETSYLPTLGTYLNCLLWSVYGLISNLSSVFFINLIGSIIQLIYTFFFIILGNNKTRRCVFLQLLCTTGVAIAFIMSTLYVNARNASQVLAYGAIAANIFMFAAPLSALYDAFVKQDCSRVPVLLNIMALFCSSIWAAYGLLITNFFIAGPNIFGAILSLLQLVVVASITYRKHTEEKEKGKIRKIASGIAIDKQVSSSLKNSSSTNMLLSTSVSSESLVRLDESDEIQEREREHSSDGLDIGIDMGFGENIEPRRHGDPLFGTILSTAQTTGTTSQPSEDAKQGDPISNRNLFTPSVVNDVSRNRGLR